MKNKRVLTACPICEKEIESNLCPDCGVRRPKHKTTIRSLIVDTISNILSIERSGLGTCIAIITRPNKVVNSYMEGFRNHYQTPGRILFYTVSFLAIYISFVDDTMGLSHLTMDMGGLSKQVSVLITLFSFFSVGSYLTYLRNSISFLDHIVSVIYIVCTHFILYYLLIGPASLFFFEEPNYGYIIVLLVLAHYFVANAIVFGKKIWWRIVLNVTSHVVVTYTVITLVNVASYFISQNPDATLFRIYKIEAKLIQFIHHLIH